MKNNYFMIANNLFKQFCQERNIKPSTVKSYMNALKDYEKFNNLTIDELIFEAKRDEDANIKLKDRKIKERLIEYRSYLLNREISANTVKTYFSKIKTFYMHFEVEMPQIPNAKYDKSYQSNYLDLPTHEHIRQALDISPLDLKSIILFMSSSGTAKAETLSLTVRDFINACKDYHNGGNIRSVLDILSRKDNIVPTFYLKRVKTDKYYYTFCSPEASEYIVKYLKPRKNLKLNDKLFDFNHNQLLNKFQKINDVMDWGFKGNYRFFRSHNLRKFHASNICLSAEYVDLLQGRTRKIVHETYIKTNPEKLKEIYKSAMDNVMINNAKNDSIKQDFTIVVNVFLAGKEYNIL